MRLRKTWLQYGTGILYLFSVSVIFFTALLQEGAAVGIRERYARIGLVCAAFLLCAALAAGCLRLSRKAAETRPPSGHTLFLWEAFLTICLFGGALLVRWSLLRENGWKLTGGQEYLESGLLPFSANNGVSLYAWLLGQAVMLTGRPSLTVILLQTVLQLLGMALFSAGIRVICGRTAALTTLAVLAFAPACMSDCFRAGPQSFLFAVLSAGVLAAGLFLRQVRNGKAGGVLAAGALVLGIVMGGLLYLDRAGLALLTVPIAGLVCMPKGIRTGAGKRAGLLFLLLLWTGLSLAGCFYGKAWLQSGSLQTAFMEWQNLWGDIPRLRIWQLLPAQGEYLFLALMAGAFMNGIGFWLSDADLWTPCAFFWAGILALQAAGSFSGGEAYLLLHTAVWAAAAGAGAGFLVQPFEEAARRLSRKRADGGEDGIQIPALEEVEEEGGDTKSEARGKKRSQRQPGQTVPVKRRPKKKKAETGNRALADASGRQAGKKETGPAGNRVNADEREEKALMSETEAGKEGTKGETEDPKIPEKKPVTFIPNPLPVPKKHVKREMDYAFAPGEEHMKFDLEELPENDDFDLL